MFLLNYFDLLDYIINTVHSCSDDNLNNNTKIIEVITTEDTNNKISKDKYNLSVDKELTNKNIDKSVEIVKDSIEKVASNLGAAAAGGSVGSAMIGVTKSMLIVPRSGSILLASLAGKKLGIAVADKLIKNSNILNAKTDTTGDSIPRPVDDIFINSPGDITSPLEDLLYYQFMINILILLLIFTFLMLLFNRFIFKYNKDFIIKLVNSFKLKRLTDLLNRLNNKSKNYNDKFLLIIFIINSILLIYLL